MHKGSELNSFGFLAVAMMLVGICTSVFATCPTNKQTISVTKANEQQWKEINDHHSHPKHAIFFHDNKSGLVKFKAGYKNPPHYYENDLAGIIISGEIDFKVNGKTISLSEGDYFTIPARTCISSFSKNGATIAMFGHKPGSYEKVKSE
ncbi:TPA: cupin domain-containing protein [Legionella pneumophila]|uniref:Cupin type-2 domain-containing protein n=1 Tax=Legionella pneumophila subsp. pneumophila TaxID=91891 RepID=A0AAV2UWP6_LEGPN|nr:cupin domain-containing protein [Legionella pneumophila]MCK1847966.1 cupin domain-containing protein [Legionella pneumophila]MDI9851497.1 cupin domain-containing protein [Legionella pneumophila]MDW8853915.1 cupin domain-containing protein [Legionella pneumophila]MDW8865593.1 cupin domain-containing protein [Legionella pneumophila]MDW8920971.1 cupin domain-containing protein [Legionella pneumophila]